MFKRVFWLAGALLFPILLLLPVVGLHESRAAEAASTAAPLDVIISEVAWGGTAASTADEWIELYNNTASAIDLSGWTLTAVDGTPAITLAGSIPAGGFFLLERTDDTAVSDVTADQFFSGAIENTDESLVLRDAASQVIDTANGNGGGWPAGGTGPDFFTMERRSRAAADTDGEWVSNDGITRSGLDASGNPLNGSPKADNSSWTTLDAADLVVTKQGPATAVAGELLSYQIQLTNNGLLTATGVVLTDTLPNWLTYVSDDSGLPLTHTPPLLVWPAGELPGGTMLAFTLTAQIAPSVTGVITNELAASTTTTETNLANNRATAVTQITSGLAPQVLIDAVYYDGFEDTGDNDEAVALRNVGQAAVNLHNWQLSDGGSTATIPPNTTIMPGEILWLAKDAAAFSFSFGFAPDVVLPAWPGFSNDGDEVLLRDDSGAIQDALVYEGGDTGQNGWSGAAVNPYTVPAVFGGKGQILYRWLDQASGLPVPDSNTAADWASWQDDVINGRKVRYPGWDLEPFFFTRQITDTGTITIGIAPDNAYDLMIAALDAADHTIQIESHTFENLGIGEALVRASRSAASALPCCWKARPPAV